MFGGPDRTGPREPDDFAQRARLARGPVVADPCTIGSRWGFLGSLYSSNYLNMKCIIN